MKFEEFEINDFDQLYELFKNSFIVQVEKEECLNRLSNFTNNKMHRIFIVKENKKILGAAIVYIHDDPFKKANFATLWYYAVLKDSQGKGIGTYLLNEICNSLKEMGCSSLRLTTSATNIACQKSSEKSGFDKRVCYKKILNI